MGKMNGEEEIYIFMLGGEFWMMEKTGRALTACGKFEMAKRENV